MRLLLLLVQLATVPIYWPETLDTLGYSSHELVVIEGIVGGVDRDDGIWKVRLADAHGHHRVCVLPKRMDPPKVGAHVRVTGRRRFYAQTGAVEIDPVTSLLPVEN